MRVSASSFPIAFLTCVRTVRGEIESSAAIIERRSSGGSVWRAATVTWKPVRVFVDDVPIVAATDTVAPPPVGRFTWVSGQGLYLNLGGGNPGLRQTLVGARSYGFNMATRSWITIEGFTIQHTESRGIFMQSGCTHITIARNTVHRASANGIHAVTGEKPIATVAINETS